MIRADRTGVVPPSGATAWLTVLVAGAMAFLAVFALCLAMAAGRLAAHWSGALTGVSTIRIAAPPARMEAATEAVLGVLGSTPGVAGHRIVSEAESRALLEPWLGAEVPVDALALPRLIEIVEQDGGPDPASLRLRLEGEVPEARYDDHSRWQAPLVSTAGWLRRLAWLSSALIVAVTAATITLAAQAALAANRQVIGVLRLIGARDVFIARAFTRRFTARAASGAAAGTALGLAAVALIPSAGAALGGGRLAPEGLQWLVPMTVPLAAAATAFLATRSAARRSLARIT